MFLAKYSCKRLILLVFFFLCYIHTYTYKEVFSMRYFLLVFLLILFFIPTPFQEVTAIPTDSHPCYDPDDVFTWCNLNLPSRRFERNERRDECLFALVTVGSIDYYVHIYIEGVYNANGQRMSGCRSTAATPGSLWNTWICAWNVGDPWYQNWDTYAGGNLKMMLYCYPLPDCLSVFQANPQSQYVALFLNGYLNDTNNMLYPSTSAPRLDPVEDEYHVYAMRPPAVGRSCPQYSQPRGCP